MALPLSTQARVGRRIALTVWWTMLLIVGVTIGLLVLVPGIQDSIQRASGAVAGGAFALSVAVALIMLGLWGISANNRNLKHVHVSFDGSRLASDPDLGNAGDYWTTLFNRAALEMEGFDPNLANSTQTTT